MTTDFQFGILHCEGSWLALLAEVFLLRIPMDEVEVHLAAPPEMTSFLLWFRCDILAWFVMFTFQSFLCAALCQMAVAACPVRTVVFSDEVRLVHLAPLRALPP